VTPTEWKAAGLASTGRLVPVSRPSVIKEEFTGVLVSVSSDVLRSFLAVATALLSALAVGAVTDVAGWAIRVSAASTGALATAAVDTTIGGPVSGLLESLPAVGADVFRGTLTPDSRPLAVVSLPLATVGPAVGGASIGRDVPIAVPVLMHWDMGNLAVEAALSGAPDGEVLFASTLPANWTKLSAVAALGEVLLGDGAFATTVALV